MSFEEIRKGAGGKALDGVSIAIGSGGHGRQVRLAFGPAAIAALGVAFGQSVALLLGAGADAGRLRVKRAAEGFKVHRHAGLSLRVVCAPWPGAPEESFRAARVAWRPVGAGEIEIDLPEAWGGPGAEAEPARAGGVGGAAAGPGGMKSPTPPTGADPGSRGAQTSKDVSDLVFDDPKPGRIRASRIRPGQPIGTGLAGEGAE
ncbi:MAG TPA: hypothetical protein VLA52_18220 [Thermohalobaculum sp.]|nr:hypothetical protein [Thermohalobaculum sp.]